MKLDEAEQSQRHTAEAQRYLGAALTDAVSDFALEGRSAAEVFENLTKSLAKAAIQATLMGTGPLGGLFGMGAPQGGGAGGLIGTLISAVAGGAGGSPTGGVRLFAGGGIVTGPGTGTSDEIPAMISNGEAVIPARAVANNRSLVEALITDRLPRYASGMMPAGVMMSASMRATEAAMGAMPEIGATPVSPGISAPITVHMQGSSGDPAVDRGYIEQTAAALRNEMRSVFHQEQANSMRTNGTLWKAGLRRSS